MVFVLDTHKKPLMPCSEKRAEAEQALRDRMRLQPVVTVAGRLGLLAICYPGLFRPDGRGATHAE